MARRRTLGVVLFPRFELLDVFGPLEMLGFVGDEIEIQMLGEKTGPVASAFGPRAVAERSFAECPHIDLLFVPGGLGTRSEVDNVTLREWLVARAASAELVLSVCTGAGLLARAGILDGHRATSNKRSFAWVVEQGPRVQWVPKARWVRDGKFATSSGVAAGIDMTLAVIAELFGAERAEEIANRAEYDWHRDAAWDPFAALYGLSEEKGGSPPRPAPPGTARG